MTSTVLERHGYRVLTAEDGTQGLGLFREHHHEVALVITDAVMPTMRSSTLISKLREIEPSVPIVTMSGLAPESAEVADGSAVNFFLPKPFRSDDLLVAVRTALDAGA